MPPLLFAQESVPQIVIQKKEPWEKLLDYSSWAVAGAMMLVIVWRLSNRLIEWVPRVGERAMASMDKIDGSQVSIVNMQTRLLDLHERTTTAVGSVAEALKAKMDRLGLDYRDHVFSSSRVEEFLLLSLDVLEEFVDRHGDEQLRSECRESIARMRQVVSRR